MNFPVETRDVSLFVPRRILQLGGDNILQEGREGEGASNGKGASKGRRVDEGGFARPSCFEATLPEGSSDPTRRVDVDNPKMKSQLGVTIMGHRVDSRKLSRCHKNSQIFTLLLTTTTRTIKQFEIVSEKHDLLLKISPRRFDNRSPCFQLDRVKRCIFVFNVIIFT